MSMTPQEALDSFSSDDLIGLGAEADGARNKIHPENVATYVIDLEVDLGIVSPDGGNAALSRIIEDSMKTGNTGIRMSGFAQHSIESVENFLRALRHQFPQIRLHGFSSAEILSLAHRNSASLNETIQSLQDAGLDSISENGIRIPQNGDSSSFEECLLVHRTAHNLGMRTSISLVFGAGESFEKRFDALKKIGQLQEETGGLAALTPRSYAPERELDAPTGVEYLKMLAISRLYLPHIENIQVSSVSQGQKVLQMGLRFGANDAGPIDGAEEQSLRRIIRDAGFRPAQRDVLYRMMYLN